MRRFFNQIMTPILLLAFLCSLQTQAELVDRTLQYSIAGKDFEGTLVFDDTWQTPKPGLLMVPNWMGPTEQSLEKARMIAAKGYVVFMADMYGVEVRPQNTEEASAAAGTIRADRSLMRERAKEAVALLKKQEGAVPLDTSRIGAIGFCFGGGTVLELARSGVQLSGVVSFHGNLDTPKPEDAKQIQTPILVLHGGDDPYVPPAQVAAFHEEMQQTDAPWEFVSFGNTVHSFTNPYANNPGKAAYDKVSSDKAFAMMHAFFGWQ